ncbi:outer membrane lipoprotein chaperone LolA [Simiduia agarivorans]|uniref:Outer-membrane lipoprotein carrier protein n=1 Tax=Simiduia agarivorans (strain DSM 21679 / JCM 13881 / BCRC 17597 / SA1) TaxID=1117647 RepID=H8YI00_SIMAS|nr:outer membrane lipoprotein chaperone LolA [Simiduia agarivorans]AFD30850.1 LolA [Simiduia agarivorans SA1 = DSM 21679]AFU97830.1 Outer membrane lipoprotein carrier protein LolA [Simiduia agarivorans SA1 = DSM 21679]
MTHVLGLPAWRALGVAMKGLLLSGLAVTALASEPVVELSALLTNMQSASGQFEQSLRDGEGKLLQASQGKFLVKKPGKFLWDTQSPFPQLLVSNGKRLWLYDPDLEQASLSKVDQKAQQTPALLLSGDPAKISDSFSVKRAADKANGLAVYDLRAKDGQANFGHISATFKGKTLVRMRFEDKLNNQTEFVFEQVAVNPALEDSLFEFTPPPGTDVIHND